MKFFNRKSQPPGGEKKKVLDDKTLLKLARQYIDENNTKEAIKCCKKVLKNDKNNYLALVLLGRSQESSEDALVTYEKALIIKPHHPLAWQGLAKYYEGKEDLESKIKLLGIYEKIITLEIEEECVIKILEKHGELACLTKNSDTINHLLIYMNEINNEKILQTARKQLLLLLQSEVPYKREDISLAILNLKKLFSNHPHDLTSDLILAKLILQNTDFGSAIKEIIELNFFSENICLKSWLCEFICKVFVKNDSFCGFEIDIYMDKLTEGIEDKKCASILMAAIHYKNGEYKEAYQQCSLAIKKANEIDMTEGMLMLNCAKMLKNLTLLEHLSMFLSIKDFKKNTDIIPIVYNSLLAAYVEQKRCYEAVTVLKQIPMDNIDANVLLELGHLYNDSTINAGLVMNILDSTKYRDLFEALSYIKKRKISKAILALRLYDEHPIKYYLLARLYYKINFREECLDNLHRANELIPDNPKVFYCLGMYYYKQDRNIVQCKKYLEKSYNICDTDKEVIKMLSLIYDKLKKVDLEYELLKRAYRTIERKEFWVCTRLGRICYAKGYIYESIAFLVEAINLNHGDITAFEWIGDAYFHLKDYDEARVAYEAVLELSVDTPVLIYALNKIGTIYSIQKKHLRAIFMFEGILDTDPDNVTALRGITENRLIIAKKSASCRLFYIAREEVQNAVSYVTKSLSKFIKDDIYWHLLGDLLIFIARLPIQCCHVKLNTTFHHEIVRNGKAAIYETAIQCFSNLLSLRDVGALFKCANAYYEYCNISRDHTLRQIAYDLAVLCVKEKPNAWQHWNLLGKLCYSKGKYNLAHHSFMTALHLQPPTKSICKIWCDLALLFIKLNRKRIARHCLLIGRPALPPYLAERIEDDLQAQIIEEDRHVGHFINGPFSHFHLNERDFEDWENVTLELEVQENEPCFDSPIESFLSVPNTNEVLKWYLSLAQDTARGCSYLGRIHENNGWLSSALAHFENASTMFDADEIMQEIILLDRARVLLKMQRLFDAVRIYGKRNVVDVRSALALAIALRTTGSYAESYTAYNFIMTHFSNQLNNDEQIKMLLEMTDVAYISKDSSFAATVLDRAIEVNSPPVGGTYPFIKSYLLTKVAFEIVATFMAERQTFHINEPLWWYYRGLNYLRGPKTCAKDASKCIQRAIDLALNSEYSEELGKMHAMVAIAEFYSGDRTRATKYAQEALTVYPGQAELWAALILCVFSHRNRPDRESWIFRALYAVRQNVSLSGSIRQWLRSLEEKLIWPE